MSHPNFHFVFLSQYLFVHCCQPEKQAEAHEDEVAGSHQKVLM